jgi:hypothetical protein
MGFVNMSLIGSESCAFVVFCVKRFYLAFPRGKAAIECG